MKFRIGIVLVSLGWLVFLGLVCWTYLGGHADEEARPVALLSVVSAIVVPWIAGYALLMMANKS